MVTYEHKMLNKISCDASGHVFKKKINMKQIIEY